ATRARRGGREGVQTGGRGPREHRVRLDADAMTSVPYVLVTKSQRRAIQSRSRRKIYRIGLAVGLWTLASILLCRKELSETRGAVAAITAMAGVTLLLGWGIAGRLRRSEA